jgi:hypothetical protein
MMPVPLIELQEWVLFPAQTVQIARSQHLHLHQPAPDEPAAETMCNSIHVITSSHNKKKS